MDRMKNKVLVVIGMFLLLSLILMGVFALFSVFIPAYRSLQDTCDFLSNEELLEKGYVQIARYSIESETIHISIPPNLTEDEFIKTDEFHKRLKHEKCHAIQDNKGIIGDCERGIFQLYLNEVFAYICEDSWDWVCDVVC